MTTDSSNLIGLRLTTNPVSAMWQVPAATAEFTVVLIGWVMREAPLDAGVPKEAAQILSEWLTRLAVVTFLHSPPESKTASPNRWSEVDGGWITVLTRPGIGFGQHPPFPLLSTRDLKIAQLLFSAEPFDWSQQGQVALLTEGGQPPPTVNYDVVEKCFHRQSLADIFRLPELRLLGLIYPAVDGDFAALISANPEFIALALQDLSGACDAAKLSFTMTSEEEFRSTTWTGQVSLRDQ